MMSKCAADSSVANDVMVLSAADTIRALLVGVAVKDTLQEDLEHAAGVLRRTVAWTTRACAQSGTSKMTEEARMKLALVLDTLNRVDEALSRDAETEDTIE